MVARAQLIGTGSPYVPKSPIEPIMSILLFLKSLFEQPRFEFGIRVNHVRGGSIQRTDGYVVGQTESGVWVEWPRGGRSLLPGSELARIG